MKRKLTLLFSLYCLGLHTFCIHAQQKETWVTILVHGIMSVKPHISLTNFLRFLTDDVNGTIYAGTVKIMRHDPYFFHNQAMQGAGLKKIDPHALYTGSAPSATALILDTMLNFVYGKDTIDNHFYTYGWSGLLSVKHRLRDGHHFYKALQKMIAEFLQKGITPKIRIIAYSHGGNVSLNLARAHRAQENKHTANDAKFIVNELVLLGMPVQGETDHLINDPIFERIYNIYSLKDRVQPLDLFSPRAIFSQRTFQARKGFSLPDKLYQIQLKCTRNTRTTRAHKNRLNATYDFQNPKTISGKSAYLRDASPGHTELWFYGWTPNNYRHNHPLYPLPCVALVPALIHATQQCEKEKNKCFKPTIVDIRPEHEIVLVRNGQSKNVIFITKFLPKKTLDYLKEMALSCAPESYPLKVYNDHIKLAYDQAVIDHRNKHRKMHTHPGSKRRRRAKSKRT